MPNGFSLIWQRFTSLFCSLDCEYHFHVPVFTMYYVFSGLLLVCLVLCSSGLLPCVELASGYHRMLCHSLLHFFLGLGIPSLSETQNLSPWNCMSIFVGFFRREYCLLLYYCQPIYKLQPTKVPAGTMLALLRPLPMGFILTNLVKI